MGKRRSITSPSIGYIYGLVDLRTLTVRYVGQAVDLAYREDKHRRDSPKLDTYLGRWLRSLFKAGSDFQMVVLETVPYEDINPTEVWWIKYGRMSGWRLTNLTDGGTGASPGEANVAKRPDVRAKLSNIFKGRPLPLEQRLKISAACMGRPGPVHTPETIEHLRQINTGKVMSPESRRKMSESKKGVPANFAPETIEAKRKLFTEDNPVYRPGVIEKISANHKKSPAVQANVQLQAAKRRLPDVKCGTTQGYRRAQNDKRRGKPNCGPCTDCKRAVADAAASKRPPKQPKAIPECGTTAGYMRAMRLKSKEPVCGGDKPCDACKAAKRGYDRARARTR